MNEQELKNRLEKLSYPCYLIVHGPARESRTRYRSEHSGAFRSDMAQDAEAAFQMIFTTHYLGHYSEMDLIAISIEEETDEDEMPTGKFQLKETIV